MFIDTPETIAARAFVLEELKRATNNVTADLRAFREGRSYMTKRQARDNVVIAKHVYTMYSRVGGYDERADTEAVVAYRDAIDRAHAAGIK